VPLHHPTFAVPPINDKRLYDCHMLTERESRSVRSVRQYAFESISVKFELARPYVLRSRFVWREVELHPKFAVVGFGALAFLKNSGSPALA
jgi:hypothetical protein